MWSSSVAAPPTSRPGWRGGARDLSGSTSRRRSSRPRGRCSRVGLEFPLLEANAEDVPLPDASFDLVALRVRRVDLVRPVPLDPGGGPPAAAGRRARLPAQLDDLHALRRPRRLARDAADGRSAGCTGSTGRTTTRPSSSSATATCSSCCATRDSTCSTWSSSTPPDEASDADYYLSDAQWAKKWPWEEIWRARKR